MRAMVMNTRSSRDQDELRGRLQTWLPHGSGDPEAAVTGLDAPSANGMSSETLLVDATVGGVARRLVVRVAPDTHDVPVFPTYDLEAQFEVIRVVHERTDVPVPTCHWLELDPSWLGAPFFVMDRVDGRVPPDVMPYTFEGWMLDADPADRRRLQDATVRQLAGVHSVPASAVPFLGTGGLREHVDHWRAYYEWSAGWGALPIVDRGFRWIEDHWPADEGESRLSWGDARIGNVLYDGFEPVALLDWEMATVAPRGVDVGWMRFLHVFMNDIAEAFEAPGLPGLFTEPDVRSVYEAAAGVELTDLAFYDLWAALRHAVVMARVEDRRIHFGEVPAPADPEAKILHRDRLARMLDGERIP
jgi:aminoglycoside phosphotransferase (APT) family kinase protein